MIRQKKTGKRGSFLQCARQDQEQDPTVANILHHATKETDESRPPNITTLGLSTINLTPKAVVKRDQPPVSTLEN